MKSLAVSLLIGLLASGPTNASELPDPSACTVLPADALVGLVLCPAVPLGPISQAVNTITVISNLGEPMADAAVVVLLTSATSACPGTVLTGSTSTAGVCTITLSASGCSGGSPGSGVIKANGITIRSYSNVKSPDFDGAGGNGVVDLADLLSFAAQFNGQHPAECHDYDNNHLCNLGDLVVFSGGFTTAKHCL